MAAEMMLRRQFRDRTGMLGPERSRELANRLQQAHQVSVAGWSNEFAVITAAAWDRYHGNDSTLLVDTFIDDGVKPRSTAMTSDAVTREVHAVTNRYCDSIMSVLMKQNALIDFSPPPGRDNILGYVGRPPDYALMARHVENVIRAVPHIRATLEMAVREALVARVGFVRVEGMDCAPQPRVFLNKNEIEFYQISQNPRFKIVRMATDYDPAGFRRYHMEVMETMSQRTMIQYVPAMDMVWPRGCRTFDQSLPWGPDYLGQRVSMTIDTLAAQYANFNADHYSQYQQGTPGGQDMGGIGWSYDDPRRYSFARAAGDYASVNVADSAGERGLITRSQREMEVMDEYIRFDLNGDGYDELVNVRRIQSDIFHIAPVRQNPFVAFCCRPINGYAVGESVDDMVGDTQDQITDVRRGMLNLVGLAVAPRVIINRSAFDNSYTMTYDDFLKQFKNAGIGAHIPVPGNPGDVAQWETLPTNALEHALLAHRSLQEEITSRTGVDLSKAGDLEGMGRTATGFHMQNTESKRPIEAVADNVAEGISLLAKKVLVCEISISEGPIIVRMDGRDQMTDPRIWDDTVLAAAHVSGSIVQSEQRVANLMNFLAINKECIAAFGPDNPVCGIREFVNAVKELLRSYGIADTGRLINDVDEQTIMQMAERMQAANDNGEAEAKMAELELKKYEIELDHELEMLKIQLEIQRDLLKLAIEAKHDEMKMRIEQNIKEKELAMDAKLERKRIQTDERIRMDANKKQANKPAARAA